jgi:hypothetical protein
LRKFDLDGKFLGEIPNLGRNVFVQVGREWDTVRGNAPLNQPPGSPGWVVKLDRKSGKILGYTPVTENAGLHSVEDAGEGPMTDGQQKPDAIHRILFSQTNETKFAGCRLFEL